jgi:peptide/nickel transport system substrate-binding protein
MHSNHRRPRAKRRAGRRSAARLPVVLLASALLASACTARPEASGDGSGSGSNPGVLVHALGGEPEGLDPAQVTAGGYGDRVIIQVYEFLLDLPAEGAKPIPMLATEVPDAENGLISEDGLTYTFPIREGVKFHDGTDLDAEAVKFSWDRVMTMALPEGQSDTLTQIVESTRVVDDYTFEVTLTSPAAWFLTSVVYSIPAAVVSPAAVEANGGVSAGQPNEWMNTNMVGTGPYEFESWDRNERLTFRAFEDYWGEPAGLDATFSVSVDNAATVLGMQAGDIDLVEPVPQYVDQLSGNDNVCVEEEGFLLEPMHLAFNLNIDESTLPPDDTIPPDFFWDKRVRQAFNYAFDYEGYINVGLSGHGEPATYLSPALLGYDPDAPTYAQDLERAEQLFREAGWWDEGFAASVLVESNNPTFGPVALVLKDSLESLNPNFRINVVEVAEAQFDEAHAQTPFEYPMWVKNGDPFNDPHFLMMNYFHPDGNWGEALGFRNGYEDPDQVASLIDEASVEPDIEQREQIYQELLTVLHEDPMWIWAADEANIQIHQCWVEDFVYNPLWIMPRWAFYSKG